MAWIVFFTFLSDDWLACLAEHQLTLKCIHCSVNGGRGDCTRDGRLKTCHQTNVGRYISWGLMNSSFDNKRIISCVLLQERNSRYFQPIDANSRTRIIGHYHVYYILLCGVVLRWFLWETEVKQRWARLVHGWDVLMQPTNRYRMTPGVRHSGIVNWPIYLVYLFIIFSNFYFTTYFTSLLLYTLCIVSVLFDDWVCSWKPTFYWSAHTCSPGVILPQHSRAIRCQ